MEVKMYGKLQGIGFNIDTDISKDELIILQYQFLDLQHMFVDLLTPNLEMINKTWEKYETIARRDKILGTNIFTLQALEAMQLKPGDDYDDWLFKWTMETVDKLKDWSDEQNYLITMKVVRVDHKNWNLVGEYKKNPKWLVFFKPD